MGSIIMQREKEAKRMREIRAARVLKARALRRQGKSYTEICEIMGLKETTVRQLLKFS